VRILLFALYKLYELSIYYGMARKSKPLAASLAANVGDAVRGVRPKGSVASREQGAGEDDFSVRFSDGKMRKLLGQGRSVKIVAHVNPAMEASVQQVRVEPAGVGTTRGKTPAMALRRGEERVAAILAGPGMLTGEEMAERMGTSRVTVNAKRKSGELLGLVGNVRGHKYPDWQLGDDGRPYPVLRDIAERLAGDVWTVYRFLVRPHDELDGATGIEALREGRDREVVEAAESVARAYG
jgi:hypothetical protein